MTDLTKIFRRATYPTISPTNPANAQTGRTVLVTGGSDGIGFGIAQAYAQAGAARVILCSRTKAKLEAAKEQIQKKDGIKGEIITRSLDVSSIEEIAELWKGLEKEGIAVDVLVLNASAMGNPTEITEVVKHFHFNTIARLWMLEHFKNQPASSSGQHKVLIDITSGALHCHPYAGAAYAGSKGGFTDYCNHLADTVPETEMRIVSLHPGAVYTSAVRGAGQLPADWAVLWDDASLSAHMSIWLSTPAAAFLHGKFLWANWDVDELLGMKEKIESTSGFLEVGVGGVSSFGMKDLIQKCNEHPAPKTKDV